MYHFDVYSLDPNNLELRKNEEIIQIEPQVFSLLAYLVENRDRVVTKDELIQAIWDGRAISDGALNSRINSARRAVDDSGETQTLIKTFPRRGYRFVGKVAAGEPASETAIDPQRNGDQISIAVLPFKNVSNDPEQEYFADGISEDIIVALARVRELVIIARNSTFTYKGRSVDVQTVSQELDARYVLDGSVRKVGNRIRISAQLLDGETGKHIWADQYDRDLEDIFAVQDEITQIVVNAIGVRLSDAERTRAQLKAPSSLNAWDYYHRALYHFWQYGAKDLDESIRLCKKAIELDPSFSSAYAMLCLAVAHRFLERQSGSPETELAEMREAAIQAKSLDSGNALAHLAIGRHASLARDHALAIEAYSTAIELNPNLVPAYLFLGNSLTFSDRAAEALPYYDRAERISPKDPLRLAGVFGRAHAHLALGNFDQAVTYAKRAVQLSPIMAFSQVILAVALFYSGQHEAASDALRELLKINKDISIRTVNERAAYDDKLRKLIIHALRELGMPE